MELADKVIIGCWLGFLGYWLASSRHIKPAAERQSWLSIARNRVPTMLGGMLLCWNGPLPAWLGAALGLPADAGHYLGAALCVAGLAVAIWARRTLADNWSSNVTFRQGHELIERGPYRLARHPIYTGVLLMGLGTATARGQVSCWLGLALMCTGFWIKLKQEEGLMLRHFPEAYPDYRKRVKALVPFVV